jgi:hypothetical protein
VIESHFTILTVLKETAFDIANSRFVMEYFGHGDERQDPIHGRKFLEL